MDTSKEYIMMCYKTHEIQNLWKPEGGDWYLFDYRGTTKTGREFEKQVWGDDDKDWKKVEILCYQPDDVKNFFVSTNEKQSHIMSAQDMTKEHVVWLPRQDQLQEMVIKYGKDIKPEWFPCLLYVVDFFLKPYAIECERSTGYPFPNTMEQMWLSFVMKDKYNKVWTGDIWKTIKDI